MQIDPASVQWDAPRGPSIDPSAVKWDTEELPLSQVPGRALINAPASAAKFAGDIYTAVTNPVQTVTGLADLAAGALRAGAKQVLPEKAFQFLDQLDTPETTKRISDTATAAGGMLADRYGSYESIKRTVATDPVGALADLSTLATGGALATARVAPGVSNVMAQAASKTDPLLMGVRAGVGGVNALRSVAAAAPSPVAGIRGAVEPLVAPEAVAVNRLVSVEDPQVMLNSLRATSNMPVTPGAPAPSLSERMIGAGTPSLAVAGLETGLAKASPQAAQEIAGLQFQRTSAIQQQLARVEQMIQTQAASMAPADLSQLRKVRDDLVRGLADEQAALANTAQGVAQPLPTVRQADVGGAVQTRGAALEKKTQEKVISPIYDESFKLSGRATIDVGQPISTASRLSGDISTLMDPRTLGESVRRTLRLEPSQTPGEWVSLGPNAGYMADASVGAPKLTLAQFDEVRKALNREYGAANLAASKGSTDAGMRARNIRTVIADMDAALAQSKIPSAAKDTYAKALKAYREIQVPRFQTGESGRMLSQGQFNMPGTLPSRQVEVFLKSEEGASQFVRTFESDPRALQSMQQGVLDLYRRNIVDPTTKAVDAKKAAAFDAKYARQIDTLEAAGLNVRETMDMVRRDAAAVQRATEALTKEASKFSAAKSADEVVDLALQSPSNMTSVRNRLTPTAREALSGELVNRATSAIERGDPTAALAYLTKNEKAIKTGLGKVGAKTYDDLVGVAKLQDELAKISAQAPKSDIVTPVTLSREFTPAELTNLQVVADDLRRMRQVEQMGTPPDLAAKQMASEQAAGIGTRAADAPALFMPIYTAVKNAVRRLEERVNRKAVTAAIDLMIRDPDKLIPLLEAAVKAKAVPAKQPPRPLTIPVGVERAARGATAVNALSRDNQNAMAR